MVLQHLQHLTPNHLNHFQHIQHSSDGKHIQRKTLSPNHKKKRPIVKSMIGSTHTDSPPPPPQWGQALKRSDPNVCSHGCDTDPQKNPRFAGSRFTEAPNPSLLPKPPIRWMTDNAINEYNTSNTQDIQSKINTRDDNIVNIFKLSHNYHLNVAQTKSIVTNGVIH